MSTSVWVICIMFALVLGAFCAVIWGTKQKEKEYETGYNLGYENGGREKYNEVYNKRLLRQSRRSARAVEVKTNAANTEVGDGELQGNAVTSGGLLFGGSGIVRSDDADPGAGEVPATEGGSGLPEPDERR